MCTIKEDTYTEERREKTTAAVGASKKKATQNDSITNTKHQDDLKWENCFPRIQFRAFIFASFFFFFSRLHPFYSSVSQTNTYTPCDYSAFHIWMLAVLCGPSSILNNFAALQKHRAPPCLLHSHQLKLNVKVYIKPHTYIHTHMCIRITCAI